MQFQKLKMFFPHKKNAFSSSYSPTFPTFEVFVFFLPKKPIIRAEDTFLSNITILYSFYSKSATFSDFEKKFKIFFEKLIYFFLKYPNF